MRSHHGELSGISLTEVLSLCSHSLNTEKRLSLASEPIPTAGVKTEESASSAVEGIKRVYIMCSRLFSGCFDRRDGYV